MLLSQTTVAGSDDWWLMRLATEYGQRLPRLYMLRSYHEGENSLPDEWDAGMREAYRRFLHLSRLNMAELIVGARVDRMKPLGFRTAAPGDDTGDRLARAHWQRSQLDVGVQDFFTDAGIYGEAYLTVTGPQRPTADAQPLIVRSDGWSTITAQYSDRDWLAEAALNVGYDAVLGVEILTLFRPGYMRQAFRAVRTPTIPTNGSRWLPGRGWSWATDPIPLGYTDQVPVFAGRGRGGKGMFERHLDSLNRLSQRIRDQLTITAMQAFRQRALDGDLPEYYPADHPRAGEKVNYDEIFKAGPAAMWRLPKDAKMWESAVTDITPVGTAIKDDVRHLAGVSRTALYILSPDAANGSAEGASLARESMVFSTEDWMGRMDRALHQALATCFLATGDSVRAQAGEIQTIWASPERASATERANAFSQVKGKLSTQMAQELVLQLTPDQIERDRQYRDQEAFETPLASTGG
jgi:hypothetical protein